MSIQSSIQPSTGAAHQWCYLSFSAISRHPFAVPYKISSSILQKWSVVHSTVFPPKTKTVHSLVVGSPVQLFTNCQFPLYHHMIFVGLIPDFLPTIVMFSTLLDTIKENFDLVFCPTLIYVAKDKDITDQAILHRSKTNPACCFLLTILSNIHRWRFSARAVREPIPVYGNTSGTHHVPFFQNHAQP